MKTRESERGGAAPNVCSQTRRKLAKSKPSQNDVPANPCILRHPRTFALVLDKVQSNEGLPGAKFAARSSPRSPRIHGAEPDKSDQDLQNTKSDAEQDGRLPVTPIEKKRKLLKDRSP